MSCISGSAASAILLLTCQRWYFPLQSLLPSLPPSLPPSLLTSLAASFPASVSIYLHFPLHLPLSPSPPLPLFLHGSAVMIFVISCHRYGLRGIPSSANAAVLPAGLVAFGPLFWQYHAQAEVFSLNNAIVAAMFYVTLRYKVSFGHPAHPPCFSKPRATPFRRFIGSHSRSHRRFHFPSRNPPAACGKWRQNRRLARRGQQGVHCFSPVSVLFWLGSGSRTSMQWSSTRYQSLAIASSSTPARSVR